MPERYDPPEGYDDLPSFTIRDAPLEAPDDAADDDDDDDEENGEETEETEVTKADFR
jgi:hypothetical protein